MPQSSIMTSSLHNDNKRCKLAEFFAYKSSSHILAKHSICAVFIQIFNIKLYFLWKLWHAQWERENEKKTINDISLLFWEWEKKHVYALCTDILHNIHVYYETIQISFDSLASNSSELQQHTPPTMCSLIKLDYELSIPVESKKYCFTSVGWNKLKIAV